MLKERRAVDAFEGSSSWVGNGVGFVVAEMEEESEPMLGKKLFALVGCFFWLFCGFCFLFFRVFFFFFWGGG